MEIIEYLEDVVNCELCFNTVSININMTKVNFIWQNSVYIQQSNLFEELLISLSGPVMGSEKINKMNKIDSSCPNNFRSKFNHTGRFGGTQQETCPQINS